MLSSSGRTAWLRTASARLARLRMKSSSCSGRLDRDDFRLAAGQLGDRELEVFLGLDVGGDPPHVQQLGDVAEPGEPVLDPDAAFGGDLDVGGGLGERADPGVEVLDAGVGQQVRPQVAAHDVRLGHRVGDGGGGREGDHPAAVGGAQVVEFHLQVAGAAGPVDVQFLVVGPDVEVLVVHAPRR